MFKGGNSTVLVEFTLIVPLTLLLELEFGLALPLITSEVLVGPVLLGVEASGNVDGGIVDCPSAPNKKDNKTSTALVVTNIRKADQSG